MNRGINKEPLEEPKQKGKNTRANPIRVDVLVPQEIDVQINEISEALKVEKAATVRMLLWFGLRYAPGRELPKIAAENFNYGSKSVNRLDTRITQEMFDMITELMESENMNKSGIIKTLLFWTLANLRMYTIVDLLDNDYRK